MSFALDAIPAFRAELSALVARGGEIASIAHVGERHAAIASDLVAPLENLLVGHGLGRYIGRAGEAGASVAARGAGAEAASLGHLAVDETLSARRFLTTSMNPIANDATHGVRDLRAALDQLRLAHLHA